jgi:HAD superfamily hydrolase (TIGR01509 family)
MGLRQYRAVVFDMDGVLFDTEPLHIKAWQIVLGGLGYACPYEVVTPCIGIPDYESAVVLQRHFQTEFSSEDLLARKRAIYPEMAAAVVAPFPGVAEGLAKLREHVPIALATSCHIPETELLLECAGLLSFFPVRITAESVEKLKPAPDSFLKAMALLGSAPEHTLAVEDSPTGITAANAAGCTVLAIASSHAPAQLADAHHVFPTTAAALAWMLERV